MTLTDERIARIRQLANDTRLSQRRRPASQRDNDALALANGARDALDEITRLRDKYGVLEAMPWLGQVTAVGGEPRPNEFVARIRYREAALAPPPAREEGATDGNNGD